MSAKRGPAADRLAHGHAGRAVDPRRRGWDSASHADGDADRRGLARGGRLRSRRVDGLQQLFGADEVVADEHVHEAVDGSPRSRWRATACSVSAVWVNRLPRSTWRSSSSGMDRLRNRSSSASRASRSVGNVMSTPVICRQVILRRVLDAVVEAVAEHRFAAARVREIGVSSSSSAHDCPAPLRARRSRAGGRRAGRHRRSRRRGSPRGWRAGSALETVSAQHVDLAERRVREASGAQRAAAPRRPAARSSGASAVDRRRSASSAARCAPPSHTASVGGDVAAQEEPAAGAVGRRRSQRSSTRFPHSDDVDLAGRSRCGARQRRVRSADSAGMAIVVSTGFTCPDRGGRGERRYRQYSSVTGPLVFLTSRAPGA